MKQFLMILILLSLSSCTHSPVLPVQQLGGGQCTERLKDLPQNNYRVQMVDNMGEATGTTLSYAVTGLGYTTDFVVQVASGTAVVIALCAPLAMMVGNVTFPADQRFHCLPGPWAIYNPRLGKSAYASTRNWRCPNLNPVSQSIREVAGCFSKQGTKESLRKAKIALESLTSLDQFYNCVDKVERETTLAQLTEIEIQLAD